MLGHYATKSRRLAEDVRTLARSLGGNAVINGPTPRGLFQVQIDVDESPFLLPRKASCWLEGNASLARRKFPENKIVSIKPTAVRECRCITVGPERPEGQKGGGAEKMSASPDPGDGLFLTND